VQRRAPISRHVDSATPKVTESPKHDGPEPLEAQTFSRTGFQPSSAHVREDSPPIPVVGRLVVGRSVVTKDVSGTRFTDLVVVVVVLVVVLVVVVVVVVRVVVVVVVRVVVVVVVRVVVVVVRVTVVVVVRVVVVVVLVEVVAEEEEARVVELEVRVVVEEEEEEEEMRVVEVVMLETMLFLTSCGLWRPIMLRMRFACPRVKRFMHESVV
jgi:hypothetical protein